MPARTVTGLEVNPTVPPLSRPQQQLGPKRHQKASVQKKDSKKGPIRGPKKGPKRIRKGTQKRDPKKGPKRDPKKGPKRDPKKGPKRGQKSARTVKKGVKPRGQKSVRTDTFLSV